jgi:cobalt-zinc-cadmium efflux system membrane fusion protein
MNTRQRTALVVSLIVIGACGGRAREENPAEKAAAAAPPSATATSGGQESPAASYFAVPPEQLAHLEIAPAKRIPFTTELRTTGTVDWDQDHSTQAITQVSGPITRIVVDFGTVVKANDPLLYVASPDITSAFSTYRKAVNHLSLVKQNLERNRDLLEHKAIAQRDWEQAQADYNDAQTDVSTALQALRILGVPEKEVTDAEQQNTTVRPELPMRASIAGTIVQKLVQPGQVIQAGATTAFVIANVSTVWVQAHVYEKDLRDVRNGDTAEVRSASFPDVFKGVVTYIGNQLDAATRTTPVRVVTQNPHGFLKKDQFVDLVIHDKATRDVLVVPTSAVLYDTENLPFVYVEVEQGKFGQRSVTIGTQQNGMTEITQGLKESERVVTQGSLFLQFANSYKG